MLKKILANASVGLLVVTGLGVAAVTSASAAPVKPGAVGVCVNKASGATRLLEPNNLRRSQYGKCKSTEKKVPLPTTYAPVKVIELPAKVQFTFEGVTAVCTKGVDVAGVAAYACVKPVPAS